MALGGSVPLNRPRVPEECESEREGWRWEVRPVWVSGGEWTSWRAEIIVLHNNRTAFAGNATSIMHLQTYTGILSTVGAPSGPNGRPQVAVPTPPTPLGGHSQHSGYLEC